MPNRNRGGAYLAMLFVSAGAFGIFLFLTFYLQTTLGYSPLVTGLAFLPFPAAVVVSVNVGQIVLMPRTGPKPLVGLGLLIAAGGMVWLTSVVPVPWNELCPGSWIYAGSGVSWCCPYESR